MDRTKPIHLVPRAGRWLASLAGQIVVLLASCLQSTNANGQLEDSADHSLPDVFEWEETAPWPRHTVDASLRGADGVRLADANGDGQLDIVTGWEESGRVRAYFHPGVDSVRELWPRVDIGKAPAVEDAVWVDLNADGQLDVLSSCEGQEKSLRMHLAPANRSSLLESTSWRTEVIDCSQGVTRWMFATPLEHSSYEPRSQGSAESSSEIASHRALAIVVASKNPNGMVGILYRQSMDSQWRLQKLVDAAWVMSLDVVDVDDDGDLDILYDDRKGNESGVYYLENTQPKRMPWDERRWKQRLIGGSKREVMFMDFATKKKGKAIDDRALFQIVAPAKPNSLLVLNHPRNNKQPAASLAWLTQELHLQPTSQFGFAKSVAVGDLSGDGNDDFVFACESAVSPKSGVVGFVRDADVWKVRSISGTQGIKFDLLELVDLDGDSDLDILTCEEREGGRGLGIIWYENPSRR